jgi:hypothetical protein
LFLVVLKTSSPWLRLEHWDLEGAREGLETSKPHRDFGLLIAHVVGLNHHDQVMLAQIVEAAEAAEEHESQGQEGPDSHQPEKLLASLQ